MTSKRDVLAAARETVQMNWTDDVCPQDIPCSGHRLKAVLDAYDAERAKRKAKRK